MPGSKIPQPDSGLIERCKEGDREAFRELVEKMQSYVFKLAFRILLNDNDAKDAVQDSFIKIWKNICNYQPAFLFTTWMYKIVVNTCLDYLRTNKKYNAISIPAGENTSTPESELINKDLARHIKNLSADLPEKQKLIFVLKDLEDMSIEEISETLNISKGLVKSNLYYARKKLRENFLRLELRRNTHVV